MQRADAESCVGVPMSCRLLWRVTVFVCVDVDVAISVVFVFVRVDVVFEREFQSPQTDAEQHHPHEPFAPGGNPLHWNHVLECEQQQPHERDACRVTQAPARSRQPCLAGTTHCQRCDRRQVIWPRPDMHRPGDESR